MAYPNPINCPYFDCKYEQLHCEDGSVILLLLDVRNIPLYATGVGIPHSFVCMTVLTRLRVRSGGATWQNLK